MSKTDKANTSNNLQIIQWTEEQLDDMLKEHHLTKSTFNDYVEKSKYSYDEYVSLALEYNAPRGIKWEETRTKLYQYKNYLNDLNATDDGKSKWTDAEWYDAMWFTAEEMEDDEAIDFIYRLEYQEYAKLDDATRESFIVIIKRQIEYNQNIIADLKDKRNKMAKYIEAYEIQKKLEGFDVLLKRDNTIKDIEHLTQSLKQKRQELKLLPPENCPDLYPQEDWNGNLYLLADELIMEMKVGGEHEWANGVQMNVFRWACYKYTCNGKPFTAQEIANSYNVAKSRPSMLDEN